MSPSPTCTSTSWAASPPSTTPATSSSSTTTALPSIGGNDPDQIHVGTDLGKFLNFEEISALEVRQLLRQFADRMLELAESDALDIDIPFVGSSLHEIVGFADRWATVADQVLAQDPQTMSTFRTALVGALTANGLPSTIGIDIDAESLRFTLDGDASVNRTFPFSLDELDSVNLPLPISPADGGASLAVAAAVDFNPTARHPVGQRPLEQSLFIANPDADLTASLDADVFGNVNLGPIHTAIDGHSPSRPRPTSTSTPAGPASPAVTTAASTTPSSTVSPPARSSTSTSPDRSTACLAVVNPAAPSRSPAT